jgi:TatD DNase family protein
MKLIDNHCHLDFRQFDDDRDEVIERCRERLKAVINSGSEPAANRRALRLVEEYPDLVHPCIGAHPSKMDRVQEYGVDAIREDVRDERERIVALGEIGLDYHHEKTDEGRARQEEAFIPLLELAEELDLPAVIHSRDAEKRCLEILSSYDPPEVVMHCFNGNLDLVRESVDRGYWISVSTQVLYSSRVRSIVEEAPADCIMLETDAPFLYPGDERNEPWRVHESLAKIAEIRGEDEEVLGSQFNRNTSQAYMTEF